MKHRPAFLLFLGSSLLFTSCYGVRQASQGASAQAEEDYYSPETANRQASWSAACPDYWNPNRSPFTFNYLYGTGTPPCLWGNTYGLASQSWCSQGLSGYSWQLRYHPAVGWHLAWLPNAFQPYYGYQGNGWNYGGGWDPWYSNGYDPYSGWYDPWAGWYDPLSGSWWCVNNYGGSNTYYTINTASGGADPVPPADSPDDDYVIPTAQVPQINASGNHSGVPREPESTKPVVSDDGIPRNKPSENKPATWTFPGSGDGTGARPSAASRPARNEEKPTAPSWNPPRPQPARPEARPAESPGPVSKPATTGKKGG